jgi:hypothetical protein
MAEPPEVSRGHSSVKRDVPGNGSTNGARRAEQRKSYEREECKAVRGKQKTEKSGCPAEDREEPEEKQGAQSTEVCKTANGDSATEMLHGIC